MNTPDPNPVLRPEFQPGKGDESHGHVRHHRDDALSHLIFAALQIGMQLSRIPQQQAAMAAAQDELRFAQLENNHAKISAAKAKLSAVMGAAPPDISLTAPQLIYALQPFIRGPRPIDLAEPTGPDNIKNPGSAACCHADSEPSNSDAEGKDPPRNGGSSPSNADTSHDVNPQITPGV